MPVEWNGVAVAERVLAASRWGIDRTMSDCVRSAKANHPWQNRTGTAEGSIQIVQFGTPEGSVVVGRWGSVSVRYFIFLELGTSRMPAYPVLRPTGDTMYPRLRGYIAAALAGMGA